MIGWIDRSGSKVVIFLTCPYILSLPPSITAPSHCYLGPILTCLICNMYNLLQFVAHLSLSYINIPSPNHLISSSHTLSHSLIFSSALQVPLIGHSISNYALHPTIIPPLLSHIPFQQSSLLFIRRSNGASSSNAHKI